MYVYIYMHDKKFLGSRVLRCPSINISGLWSIRLQLIRMFFPLVGATPPHDSTFAGTRAVVALSSID